MLELPGQALLTRPGCLFSWQCPYLPSELLVDGPWFFPGEEGRSLKTHTVGLKGRPPGTEDREVATFARVPLTEMYAETPWLW